MFKRVRWAGIGAVVGVAGSAYAQIKVRRSAQRYLPPAAGRRLLLRARWLGQEVHDAVGEGRDAMAEREAELRARIDAGRAGPAPEVRDATTRPLDRPRGHPTGGVQRANRERGIPRG